MLWLYLLFAFAAGVVLPFQAGINTELAEWLHSPVRAAFVSFLVGTVILLVAVHHRLPWVALALVLARDALLIGGYKLLMPRGYELDVNFLGKLATWVLYASLAFVMVTHEGTDWPLWIFWTGVALAAVALGGYLLKVRREVGA